MTLVGPEPRAVRSASSPLERLPWLPNVLSMSIVVGLLGMTAPPLAVLDFIALRLPEVEAAPALASPVELGVVAAFCLFSRFSEPSGEPPEDARLPKLVRRLLLDSRKGGECDSSPPLPPPIPPLLLRLCPAAAGVPLAEPTDPGPLCEAIATGR